MLLLAKILAALIGAAHVGFLVFEMFFWSKPLELRVFKDSTKASKILAANQGLYNGFLAAGLVWGVSTLTAS
jgi:putative membrane protein